ncbi:MAG: AgmX/PglI C-terminal domain-containing protein [Deltaproteobacteria bacterium]|nr:AgmX/PglI C-terminal domain-containing protein [Deltaproteobacteria bacterium]
MKNISHRWPLLVVVLVVLILLGWGLYSSGDDSVVPNTKPAVDGESRTASAANAQNVGKKELETTNPARSEVSLEAWKKVVATSRLAASAKTAPTELQSEDPENHKTAGTAEGEDKNDDTKLARLKTKEDPRGTLSRKSIQSAISSAVPKVRECFEKALKSDPSIAGKVVLRLEIVAEDGVGIVKSGRIKEEETYSPAFEKCVLQKNYQSHI